ncbi:hypothetical protein AVEN_126150-1 [Araneus ventricosus]|uniref:Uncharacterized protein n=1 Tax=Araneus ventricosus TaxID=182803 RepID=A0A4Y2NZS5_ARAVE|nr:hypothetical protein AVEN_126150-1 [Araneus ventricosus]
MVGRSSGLQTFNNLRNFSKTYIFVFNSLIPRRLFLLAPLKQGLFGRKRHELGLSQHGWSFHHHPTPCCNIPLRRTDMGCGWQGQLDPLPHLSPKRSQNLPSKETNPLRPAMVAVKGKFLDSRDRLAGSPSIEAVAARWYRKLSGRTLLTTVAMDWEPSPIGSPPRRPAGLRRASAHGPHPADQRQPGESPISGRLLTNVALLGWIPVHERLKSSRHGRQLLQR